MPGDKEIKKAPNNEAKPEHLREREQFKALLFSNPNYFGNLKESPFKAALQIASNTTYEEIGCVGFQPQADLLEAVVYVKQPVGYGGNVCSPGTQEHVRFYLSMDNGATWQDLGVASFTAYDIPGTAPAKRLEYAVTKEVHPGRRFCFETNLALVRAILSWNLPPPPNAPNFHPVWGNVHDTHIQVEPRRRVRLTEALEALKIQMPPQIAAAVDVMQEVEAPEPKELALPELHALYKGKDVEPHRFGLAEVHKLTAQAASSEALWAPGFKGFFPGLEINWGDIVGKLFPTDGDTRYEKMECIGLDTRPTVETLVGVIRVKLPYGYSGNPCTAGSREYVTFWADFDNNGTFETCLGTTSVRVYDIDKIPKEGLEYAVFLPVDLNAHRQPCKKGPKVVRVRAILSWQVAPPCNNPNYVPVWGNRLETLIHIRPGAEVQPGTHPPFIETVGGMDVVRINNVTGLADGPATTAAFTADQSPFGGVVVVTGHIANPPDISQGALPLKYRVYVSNDGGATWQRRTDTFTIGRSQFLNGLWSNLPDITQSVDADDYYTYREDLLGAIGNPQIFVKGNVLARWDTGGQTGLWLIKIEAKDPANNLYPSAPVTVRLDNAAPVVHIQITSGGGPCGDFTIGGKISGTYSVSDEHTGLLIFSVQPAMGGQFTAPAPWPGIAQMPLVRRFPVVPTAGEAGNWTLDTTGMPKCGYVVYLQAWDRTIVNSGYIGYYGQDVQGFCLRV